MMGQSDRKFGGHGIPFSLTHPVTVPAWDEKTTAQFNQMMSIGLRQAKEAAQGWLTSEL